jgi:acetate kinase
MAFTLVINPGSSSKKFALFRDTTLVLDAYVERSDDGFEMCSIVGGVQQKCDLIDKKEYKNSLRNFLGLAAQSEYSIEAAAIVRVVLRVVAPGTYFQKHQRITDAYVSRLAANSELAPLHIPHVLQEIEAVRQFLPEATLIGVSDSAFHATMPEVARRYSLPASEAAALDLYRFGYHGLSVASVMRRMLRVCGCSYKNVIVCHIGSGVSVTAVRDGQSIDTTMGYAPGSGVLMGSRAGDVDAGALLALMQQKNLKPKDAQVYLQSQGGLRALGGESDLRLLLERKAKGDANATLAIDAFIYHLQKTIGAYSVVLGGVDAILLTATASERSSALRAALIRPLTSLGIELDETKNDACVSRDGIISTTNSRVCVAVIKTAEADELLHQSLTIE